MAIEPSDYQEEQSGLTDLSSEFLVNRAVVNERIQNIQTVLMQYSERMDRIENDLKAIEHIRTIQDQLKTNDNRMTRIENDWKSLIKWWVAITGTISGAVIGAAKLFFGQ